MRDEGFPLLSIGFWVPFIDLGDTNGAINFLFFFVDSSASFMHVPFWCCRDMDCSMGTALPCYSGYFGTDRPTEEAKGSQEAPGIELTQNGCLSLQLGGQHPFDPSGIHPLGDRFKPEAGVNFPEGGAVDFQGNFPAFDSSIQNWASSSGSCCLSMFDENSYPQVGCYLKLSLSGPPVKLVIRSECSC